jgi:hypothetical protein
MKKPDPSTDMAGDLAAAIDPTNYPGVILREEADGRLFAADGHEVSRAELELLQEGGKIPFRMPNNHRDPQPAGEVA